MSTISLGSARASFAKWSIRQKIFRLLCLVISVVVLSALSNRIVITTTPSLDHRIFFEGWGDFEIGDYISFVLTTDIIVRQRITKKIACVEGQRIDVLDRSFFCDGQYLGDAKETYLTGEPYPIASETAGIIPTGKAFVLGDHKDSYDSRAWGFVDLAGAQRVFIIF